MVILLFETTFILHLFILLYYIYAPFILHFYIFILEITISRSYPTSPPVVRVTRCLAERRRSARVTKATAPEWCRAEPWLFGGLLSHQLNDQWPLSIINGLN